MQMFDSILMHYFTYHWNYIIGLPESRKILSIWGFSERQISNFSSTMVKLWLSESSHPFETGLNILIHVFFISNAFFSSDLVLLIFNSKFRNIYHNIIYTLLPAKNMFKMLFGISAIIGYITCRHFSLEHPKSQPSIACKILK